MTDELEPRSAPGLITDSKAGWLKYAQQHDISNNISPFVRLHNEILEFCDYVKLDQQEIAARRAVINDVERIALTIWPAATVHVFGSEFTGIILPTSDLDFVVMDCPDDEHDALYLMQEVCAYATCQLVRYVYGDIDFCLGARCRDVGVLGDRVGAACELHRSDCKRKSTDCEDGPCSDRHCSGYLLQCHQRIEYWPFNSLVH